MRGVEYDLAETVQKNLFLFPVQDKVEFVSLQGGRCAVEAKSFIDLLSFNGLQ